MVVPPEPGAMMPPLLMVMRPPTVPVPPMVAPLLTPTALPATVEPVTNNVPLLIVVAPVYVQVPDNVHTPLPVLVSAVATMWQYGGATVLSVYHNHFAAVPIEPSWYRSAMFRHFAYDAAEYAWRHV